jgi:3D (Asp-Asp-Asp) domain-containing protein
MKTGTFVCHGSYSVIGMYLTLTPKMRVFGPKVSRSTSWPSPQYEMRLFKRNQKFGNNDRIAGCFHLELSNHRSVIIRWLQILLLLLACLILYQGHAYGRTNRSSWMRFTATAYSVSGETKAQTITEEGRTLAADPAVLPIGTVVEIRNAGPYSGQYVVSDTGQKIVGQKLDIYIASTHEAMEFGKRRVKIRILKAAPETPREQRRAAADALIAPKPPKDDRVSAYYQYPQNTTETSSVQ